MGVAPIRRGGDKAAPVTSPPISSLKLRWGLIGALGALTAFPAMSTDIYLPALPAMAKDLAASPEQTALTLSAFFVGLAIGQLVYGPWSDRVGRRIPLMAGIGIYIIASVGCAFAKTPDTLIALRFIQALGGSAGPVIARATVRDRFEPQDSARVLAYLGLVFGMAPILGPIAGAALLLAADWRGIFFMLAILAALIGAISYFYLDEVQPLTPRPQQRETLRASFVAPLKDAKFIRYTFVLSLGGAMMLTYVSQSPGLFIEGFGFDPQQFALIFALNAAGFIAVGQINARILRRAYFDVVLRRGLYAALCFAALVFFFAFTSIGGVWAIGIPLFLTISSLGFVFGNATVGGLATQGERAGMASSLMGAVSTITAALAMAVAGALHDGTPKAMASIILTCAAAASLALIWKGQTQLRFAASSAAVKPDSEN